MSRNPTNLVWAVLPLLLNLPAGARAAEPPGRPAITVQASWPGATAQQVLDAVAPPLEHHLNCVEGLADVTAVATADGALHLTARFAHGTDLNRAQLLVQNRVSLALPQLPESVREAGLRVEKQPPGVLLLLALTSPQGVHDAVYLGNYATLHIRPALARVAGVGEVRLLGVPHSGLNVWLDPEHLAARALTPADALRALREALHGPPGTRPAGPDQMDDLVLSRQAGVPVRLRDVARCEVGGQGATAGAAFDSRAAAVVAIAPTPEADPRAVEAGVRKALADLQRAFPPGVEATVAHAFGPGHLLAEVALPAAASAERVRHVLDRAAALVKRVAGVEHVLTLPESPFTPLPGGPCLLLTPAGGAQRDQVAHAARAALAELLEAAVRWRPAEGLGGGYPVELALSGPDAAAVRQWADRLAAQLTSTGQLTDVAAEPRTDLWPRIALEVDRAKAAALGLTVADVTDTANAWLAAVPAGEIHFLGQTVPVTVRVGTERPTSPEALPRIRLRSATGQLVPLGAVVAVRQVAEPAALARANGWPMVALTANPGPGVTLAAARGLGETLAEESRPAGPYRWAWVRQLPAPPRPAGAPPAAGAPAPPVVTVSRPVVREHADMEEFTGHTAAVNRVDLRARVTGYLEQAHFQEGAEVKQGDLLFTIDARPYQAELDRATAALQRAEAKLRLAATNLDRVSRLQGAGGASPEEVAQARASREEAEADLRLGRAALDIVRLNLAFTRVVAPIAGRIGRRLVDPGNLVKADETPLATLVSVDPLLVDFAVDERTLLRLRRAAREGPPRPALTAHLGLAHEAGFPREAAVQLADNQLDPATGTFRLRAVLANPAGDLLPGLFVRVRLPVGPARPVLLVPAEAVGTDQGQRFVYAVDARNQVVERRVTLGPEVEGMRVIERGLEASERVITAGLARVRPGQAVQPQEAPR